MKPWRYRPPTVYAGEEPGIDWEDNWLSNSLAWASVKTRMDQARWPHLIANPFWSDCSTCLFWRGALMGSILTAAVIAIIVGA